MSLAPQEQHYSFMDHTGHSPAAASTPNSMSRAQPGLPRHGSALPADPHANNKQADVYVSELLSYSLDRLRKVGRPENQ